MKNYSNLMIYKIHNSSNKNSYFIAKEHSNPFEKCIIEPASVFYTHDYTANVENVWKTCVEKRFAVFCARSSEIGLFPFATMRLSTSTTSQRTVFHKELHVAPEIAGRSRSIRHFHSIQILTESHLWRIQAILSVEWLT